MDVAKDMVTRGLWTVPVGLGLGALAAGFNGAVSVAPRLDASSTSCPVVLRAIARSRSHVCCAIPAPA